MKMKITLLFSIVSIAAGSAFSAQMWTNTITGEVSAWPPSHPEKMVSVPDSWYFDQGWRSFSVAEQADHDAAVAEAFADAQAAAESQTLQPTPIPSGIVVPRILVQSVSNSVSIGVVADDDGTILTFVNPEGSRSSFNDAALEAVRAHDAKVARRESAEIKAREAGNSASKLREAFLDLLEGI